jgi:hypothetical protein
LFLFPPVFITGVLFGHLLATTRLWRLCRFLGTSAQQTRVRNLLHGSNVRIDPAAPPLRRRRYFTGRDIPGRMSSLTFGRHHHPGKTIWFLSIWSHRSLIWLVPSTTSMSST